MNTSHRWYWIFGSDFLSGNRKNNCHGVKQDEFFMPLTMWAMHSDGVPINEWSSTANMVVISTKPSPLCSQSSPLSSKPSSSSLAPLLLVWMLYLWWYLPYFQCMASIDHLPPILLLQRCNLAYLMAKRIHWCWLWGDINNTCDAWHNVLWNRVILEYINPYQVHK